MTVNHTPGERYPFEVSYRDFKINEGCLPE